jgi:hypothetical protein
MASRHQGFLQTILKIISFSLQADVSSNLSLPLSITLQPMEIRTFILELSTKQNDVILEIITP